MRACIYTYRYYYLLNHRFIVFILHHISQTSKPFCLSMKLLFQTKSFNILIASSNAFCFSSNCFVKSCIIDSLSLTINFNCSFVALCIVNLFPCSHWLCVIYYHSISILLFNTLFHSIYRGVETRYKCKNHSEPVERLRRSISFSSPRRSQIYRNFVRQLPDNQMIISETSLTF